VGIKPTWEPWAAVILVLFAVGFGYLVLQRSAFLNSRRTDAGVFFRAGYAVREGLDPYRVTDDRGWFFLYSPGVAPLLAPLGDPPTPETPRMESWRAPGDTAPPAPLRGQTSTPYLPYPASVVIWYALSVACLLLTIHWLVKALQAHSPDPHIRALSPSHGGWWNVRFWPLVACMPDILSTLSRGQISTVLLAIIAAGAWLWANNRRTLAGFWWGFAAFVKVFPGLLVVYPLARRDVRGMTGYAICFVLAMILLPLVVFGPQRTLDYNRTFVSRVLLAGLANDSEQTLGAGTSFTNTDNQSIQGSLHNLVNIATPRGERPPAAAKWMKFVHYGGFVVLVAGTLLVGRTRRASRSGGVGDTRFRPDDTALELVLRVGMLCCIMIACLPMTHRHYAIFILPGVVALVWVNIMSSRLGFLRGPGLVLTPLLAMGLAIPKIQQEGVLRDLPLTMIATLTVWGISAVLLHRLAKTRGELHHPAPV